MCCFSWDGAGACVGSINPYLNLRSHTVAKILRGRFILYIFVNSAPASPCFLFYIIGIILCQTIFCQVLIIFDTSLFFVPCSIFEFVIYYLVYLLDKFKEDFQDPFRCKQNIILSLQKIELELNYVKSCQAK
jgi:hypothetical protein